MSSGSTAKRHGRKPLPTVVVAGGLGLFAFAFRLLSSVDLSNDHYMHMAWAQQILFGEVPGRDFVDPGMPLTYMLSAFAQWVRPGPFTELAFSAALLAVAASVTYAVALRLSESRRIAMAVTLLEIAFEARLYSYPKLLVPAVALLLFQAYVRRPVPARLAALGVWTGVAELLRHDLGIYAAAGIIAGLAVLGAPRWRQVFTAIALYGAVAAVTMLPYVAFVQWTEGLTEHLRRGLEFSKGEAHQRVFELPPLTSGNVFDWNRDDSTAFLFYAMHLVVIVAVALMVTVRTSHPRARLSAAAAATAMLAAYLTVILRFPFDARIPDLAALFALVSAWILGETWRSISGHPRTRPWQSAVVALVAAAGIFATVRSVWVLENIPEAIDNTGVYGGWGSVRETYTDLKKRGSDWPWARSWPTRDLPPAIVYLDECTQPTDAVLLTWPAPEYNFFARRRFAAGHAEFIPPDAFATERDQAQMLSWLRPQRVPVVLINESRREEFARSYPQIDAYLREHYRPSGHFSIYDGSAITVATSTDLRAAGSWGPDAWPCRFETAGGAAGSTR